MAAAQSAEGELSAVRCPGSLLAALLMDAGKAAAGGRSEGLLLGCGKRRREEVRGDDVQEAGERVVLEADLTAFLRTTAPTPSSSCPEGSFYGPDGAVQGKRLARHLAAAGLRAQGQHGVVGWYVTRPMASSGGSAEVAPPPPRPTLRELAVLQSLGRHLREQQQGQQRQGQQVWTPPVLLVVALGLRPREATQAWGYGLYYLREEQDGLMMGDNSTAPSSLVPRPLLLEIRNVAHDSAAEYRAYRGGYAPALLPSEQEESAGGGGEAAVAVGAPMPPALAAMAARVPSPYVEEAELQFDALLGRLHGLVDAIKVEETRVLALQREHSRLQRRLLQQGQKQEKGVETAELEELLAVVGPSSASEGGVGEGGGVEAVAEAAGAAAE